MYGLQSPNMATTSFAAAAAKKRTDDNDDVQRNVYNEYYCDAYTARITSYECVYMVHFL